MVSRRDILVGGSCVAAGVLAVSFSERSAPGAHHPGLSLFLYDDSIDGARSAASLVRDAGVRVDAFQGDVGVPWFDAVEPLWRKGPQPIAGVTDGGAFFCLQQLARHHKLACTQLISDLHPGQLSNAATALLRAATRFGPAILADPVTGPVAWLLQPMKGPGR
jgi:hypothetical protein